MFGSGFAPHWLSFPARVVIIGARDGSLSRRTGKPTESDSDQDAAPKSSEGQQTKRSIR